MENSDLRNRLFDAELDRAYSDDQIRAEVIAEADAHVSREAASHYRRGVLDSTAHMKAAFLEVSLSGEEVVGFLTAPVRSLRDKAVGELVDDEFAPNGVAVSSPFDC